LGSRLDRRIVLASCAALCAACGAPSGVEADAGPAVGAACAAPGLKDPDFATATDWTAVREAALAPGSVTFSAAAMCDSAGIIQTLPSSPLGCVRPLVLSFDVSVNDGDQVSFAAGVGGGWNLPVLFDAETIQLCLGANAFGDAPALFLGPGDNPGVCPAPPEGGPSLAIEHVLIAADVLGACPLPGTVPNGDFERGASGWTTKPGDGVAEVAPGLGERDSSAIHLATEHDCEQPSLSEAISLPTNAMLPNPALRVWSNGSANAVVSIRMGSLLPTFYTGATYLPGRGAPVTSNVCIPRWAQGTVQALEISYVSTRITETCADDLRDYVVDGLSFVSEPACAAGADLFDPGFEQVVTAAGVAPFWTLEHYDDQPNSDVALVTDGTSAHSGVVGARFRASTPCPRASISGSVTVPTSVGAAGPALKLWYETNTGTHGTLEVSMNAFVAPVDVPPAAAWTQATICLDPHLAGRPELLRFTLVNVDGGGTCADTFPEETVGLDDVELGTDPGCAAM
jgi:hypothetical protein